MKEYQHKGLTWSDRMQYKNWYRQELLCPPEGLDCCCCCRVTGAAPLCRKPPLPFWAPPRTADPDLREGSDTELGRLDVIVVDLNDGREFVLKKCCIVQMYSVLSIHCGHYVNRHAL